MRAVSWYVGLGILALSGAVIAGVLTFVALALANPQAVGASALCAAVFLLPGIIFLSHARYLRARESALAQVAALAESRGVVEISDLGQELGISTEDAERLLRLSMRHERLRGSIDDRGLFVAETAPRCQSCGAPRSRRDGADPCASCGAPGPPGGAA